MQKSTYLTVCLFTMFIGSLRADVLPWDFSCAISSDSKIIVTEDQNGSARVWDAESGNELPQLEGRFVGFSPDGKKIFTSVWNNTIQSSTIRILDADSRLELRKMVLGGSFEGFSPENKKIVTISDGNTVRIWDTESGRELLKLEGRFIKFSSDSKKVITQTGDWDNTIVRIWDADSGKVLHKLGARLVELSPDDKNIVTASNDNTVRILDVESGKEVRTLRTSQTSRTSRTLRRTSRTSEEVDEVVFSPDGKKIVVTSYSGGDVNPMDIGGSFAQNVRIWHVDTGKELWRSTVERFSGPLDSTVNFSPDGTKVITKNTFGSNIQFWDANSGRELRLKGLGRRTVDSADFSPDGKKIATVTTDTQGSDCIVQIWNSNNGNELHRLNISQSLLLIESVFYVTFSPDGKKVVTVSKSNVVKDNYTVRVLPVP